MRQLSWRVRVGLFLWVFLNAIPGLAFIEQVMSYSEQYSTSLGLFAASGSFLETEEEAEASMKGVGVFLDTQWRRSPWTLRVDTMSTSRSSGDQGLGVRNEYRELRAWGLGSIELTETFSIYGGLGAGVIFPETKMTVLGQGKTLVSRPGALGGYLLGMRFRAFDAVFFDLYTQSVYVPVYPNGQLTSLAGAVVFQF